MDNQVKPFGIRRIIDYILTNFYIMFRTIIEYKENVYISVIQESIYNFVMIMIYFNLINLNFGDVIGWGMIDFIFFILLVGFVSDVTGLVLWKYGLWHYLITGKLNQYIIRPINSYFGYFFSNIALQGFIALSIDLIIFTFVVLYFEIELYNIGLFLFVLFFVLLLMITLDSFIKSFNFFSRGFTEMVYNLRSEIFTVTGLYPAKFYEKFTGKIIFLGFSYFYCGLLLVPLIRNYDIPNLWFYIEILIGLNIIFILGIIMLWHYGLKRYEAYG